MTKFNTKQTVLAIAVGSLVMTGCATQRQTDTAVGTGTGAVAGAVLGTAIGGSGSGTRAGAVIGAGVGAAVGYNWDRIKEKLGMATKDSGVQVSEQRDGALKLHVPSAVSFSSGSAHLDPALLPTLDNIAGTLNEHRNTMLTVVGHTDNVGSAVDNMALSRHRAEAVVDYFKRKGIEPHRMTVEARGENDPIADNATEMGRAENRRVEMLIRPMTS